MFNWFKKQQQPQPSKEELKDMLREIVAEEEHEVAAVWGVAEEDTPKEPIVIEPSESDTKDEPMFILRSIDFDPIKGFRFETDWNAAFVQHLRDNGYTGTNDEQIIQKYLLLLSRQISERLEDTTGSKNEFV